MFEKYFEFGDIFTFLQKINTAESDSPVLIPWSRVLNSFKKLQGYLKIKIYFENLLKVSIYFKEQPHKKKFEIQIRFLNF